MLLALWRLLRFVHGEVGWAEVGHVLLLGGYTLGRVLVLIAAASLLWVSVGVWIGMKPRWAGRLQALAQLLAAFPANLLFPVAVVGIVLWHLGIGNSKALGNGTTWSARGGGVRSGARRRPAPAAAAGRWLAREAPEAVSPHSLKPCSATQSP